MIDIFVGPPASKKEARLVGAAKFFTGKPCPHGHISPRYASSGHCCECDIIRGTKRHRQSRAPIVEAAIALAKDLGIQYVTRKEAKAAGLAKYFIGSKCKHGHTSQRRTNTGTCIECEPITAARWRAENPGLCKEIVSAYRRRNPAKTKEWNAAWQKENRERRRVYMRKAYRENEAIRSLMHMHARLRDAAKSAAMPEWLTIEDRRLMTNLYTEARRVSRETGVQHHVDHIVPLRGKTVCGLHVPWNLRIITANDNIKKSNKLEVEECRA